MTHLLRLPFGLVPVIALLLTGIFVHADTFVPLAPTPAYSKLGQLYQSSDLGSFFGALFVTALSVGAIIAVLRLAYAGYQYMTTDAWGSKLQAKEIIGDVVLGLLLLLGVWLILNQINPQIRRLVFLNAIKPVTIDVPQQQNPFATSPSSYCGNTGFGGFTGSQCYPTLEQCRQNVSYLSSCVEIR